MSNPDHHYQQALGFLGIESESHLKLIRQTIDTAELSGEALAHILPPQLLLISKALEEEDLSNDDGMLGKLSVDREIIKKARAILLEAITPITKHPQYPAAVASLMSKSAVSGQPAAAKEDPAQAFSDIEHVTSIPMLMGQEPPYMPMLKFVVISTNQRVLFSETLRWSDLLFLSHAVLNQVLGHAKSSAKQIRQELVANIPEAPLREVIGKIRDTAAQIEAVLASEDGGATEEKK